jgi:hypothetical protein
LSDAIRARVLPNAASVSQGIRLRSRPSRLAKYVTPNRHRPIVAEDDPRERAAAKMMEARAGVEPTYSDLQSGA